MNNRPGPTMQRAVLTAAAVSASIGASSSGPCFGQGIACSYEISAVIQAEDCPFTGANPTAARGISPNGRYVCGVHGQCDQFGEAFVYDVKTEEFFTIPRPPGIVGAEAADVNDSGLVVGAAQTPVESFVGFAYSLQSGIWTPLQAQNGAAGWSGATGVNNAGTVCGWRSIGSKGDPVNPQTAFTWTAHNGGTFTDLGLIDGHSTSAADINSAGLVSVATGFSIDPGVLAYLWLNGRLERVGPIPGGLSSGAGYLNERGWMTTGGLIQSNPFLLCAYLRTDISAFIELPALPTGFNAVLLGLTEAGLVAGHTNFGFPVTSQRACIWRNAQPIDLNDQLSGQFSGVLQSARISDNEIIVANGHNNDGEAVRAFLLTPIRSVPGDVNCDAQVNIDDLLGTISLWGPCPGCNADLTRDGAVDILDLVEVIVNWGTTGGAS